MQDWLYDEGEDETKSVYTQKLEELLRLGSPLEQREKEDRLRPPAAQSLVVAANHYNSLATSEDPKYSHISSEDRNKVPYPLPLQLHLELSV
jgi:heat shock protein 4